MTWLLVATLWVAMLASPFVLIYIFLPSGCECPRCSNETLPIRSRLFRPIRRLVSLRWCSDCGWEGLARHDVEPRPFPTLEVVPDDSGETDDEAPWRQGT